MKSEALRSWPPAVVSFPGFPQCLNPVLLLALAGLMARWLPAAEASPNAVGVYVTAQRHPMLIRGDDASMLRVSVVVAPRSMPVELKSVEFQLEATGEHPALESLALFATGDRPVFTASNRVGNTAAANPRVSIDGTAVLRTGTNHFWLSGRVRPDADLSQRVRTTCRGVTTTLGTLPVPAAGAGAWQRIGVALRRHNDDGVHTYRIPTLAVAPDGALVCVYDMRRRGSRDLQEDIDIGLSRSSDGGRTWEPPRVIMDMGTYGGLPQEQNGCSDPGLVVDRDTGEIFCFALWMWGKPGKHQWVGDGSEPGLDPSRSGQLMVVRSRDGGKTWTPPENLTRRLKQPEWCLLATSPAQGIQLKDGTLVMPSQGRDEMGVPFAGILWSRDHGNSWTVSAPAYHGGNECQVVSLLDGSLMLNVRNDLEHRRAVCITRDLGATWHPHPSHRKALIEPNCNAGLCAVDFPPPGGAPVQHLLLFANPHTQDRRTHQTIQVSLDEGLSWPEELHLLLDEGQGAGYSSLTRISSNRIGIVYEGSQAQLVFESLTLEELLRR